MQNISVCKLAWVAYVHFVLIIMELVFVSCLYMLFLGLTTSTHRHTQICKVLRVVL
jgi:hypothetical protein